MKPIGKKHWTNTKAGKLPIPAHNTIPGKSAEAKALINRWRRRKTRAGLKPLYRMAG